MIEETKYPYVLFKINDSLYCLNSRFLSNIQQMPSYEKVPKAPASVTGMFRQGDNKVVTLLDLRTELGIKSLADESEEFAAMIDARKQDHLDWLAELESCLEESRPFKLARDPHQCAFGKWYDHFETDNQVVAFHLRKIGEPHKKLHEAASKAEECLKDCDKCRRETCLKSIMNDVKNETAPQILKLMDETKDLFRSSIYREMVLVLDEINCGIVVDEIVGIEDLEDLGWGDQDFMKNQCIYIRTILQSPKYAGIIFELDVNSIADHLGAVKQML